MIKDNKRYRNFMIVFEDDRYYICKASSFSKTGNNRYNWKDIATMDEAKKIIDKYWEDKEVNESMAKNRARGKKIESCRDEDLEILNEYGDDEVEYPENPNILNLIDYYDAIGCENPEECAISDLRAMGKYKTYDEATTVSSIGQYKRSPLVNRARKPKNEDRIITKDDELNKPTNVKDDGTNDDTINIDVSTNNTPSNNDSNNNQPEEQQKDEVILKEDEMSVDDKKKWLESASNEDLLKQYVSFINQNRFGSTYEDIKLTEEEILKRMNK